MAGKHRCASQLMRHNVLHTWRGLRAIVRGKSGLLLLTLATVLMAFVLWRFIGGDARFSYGFYGRLAANCGFLIAFILGTLLLFVGSAVEYRSVKRAREARQRSDV